MPTRSWRMALALAGGLTYPALAPADEPVVTGVQITVESSASSSSESKTDSQLEAPATTEEKSEDADQPAGRPNQPRVITRKSASGKITIRLPNGETRTIDLPTNADDDQTFNFHGNLNDLDRTMAEASPPKHLIGVALAPISDAVRAHVTLPDGAGLLIASIHPDGPAAKAGLQVHDILLQVGDENITSIPAVQSMIDAAQAKPVTVTYLRRGEKKSVEITPIKREELESTTDSAATLLEQLNDHPELKDHYFKLFQMPGASANSFVLPMTPIGPSTNDAIRQLTEQVERLQQAVDRLEKRHKESHEDDDEKRPEAPAPEKDGDARRIPRRELLTTFEGEMPS